MVTLEREASTLDEFQVPDLIQIQPRESCYIQFQENPRIATQSTGLFSAETLRKYLFQFSIDADTAPVFLTSGFGQEESSLLPDEPIFGKISGEFYTMQYHIQTPVYHEILDTLSSHFAEISFDDLKIKQSAINLFNAYRHEEFDTDIAYEFTNALNIFIQDNGKSAIRIINNLAKKQTFDEDMISETLKALGRIEHENTKEQRYQVLMSFIKDDSAIIRDGAVSGLSFLDDKRALLQLRMLFETETIAILKSNIQVAIRSIET